MVRLPQGSARPADLLRSLRPRLGWIALVLGIGLLFLGWYGVSGERYTARQLPYLASATAPGAALLLAGTVLLALGRRTGGPDADQQQILRQLEILYRLLTEEAAREPLAAKEGSGLGTTAAPARGRLLVVPGGGTYHRPDCLLVQGRDDPQPVGRAAVAARGLRPCPLCDPDPVGPADADLKPDPDPDPVGAPGADPG